MKKRTPVSAIMTKEVITLSSTDDLMTAEKIFKKREDKTYSSSKRKRN